VTLKLQDSLMIVYWRVLSDLIPEPHELEIDSPMFFAHFADIVPNRTRAHQSAADSRPQADRLRQRDHQVGGHTNVARR
jgi:hypothetical protein